MLRDASIVSVFEGSTVVNLGILASQLARRGNQPVDVRHDRQRLRELYCRSQDQDGFSPSGLRLGRLARHVAFAGLPLTEEFRHLLDRRRTAIFQNTREALLDGLNMLKSRIVCWENAFSSCRKGFDSRPHRLSAQTLWLVKRYCRLHAASACLHTWINNSFELGEFFARAEWLVLCLQRLLSDDENPHWVSAPGADSVMDELVRRSCSNSLFSIVPRALL
jgi:hypothetical protein